jgi:hypothetical protein
MAGDAMGLHVNNMLPPPYKLATVKFAVILYDLCLYSFDWFLHCTILLETKQLPLDSF